MTKADSHVRMPSLNTSAPIPAAPASSADSSPGQPAAGQPASTERASESRKLFNGLSGRPVEQIGGAV